MLSATSETLFLLFQFVFALTHQPLSLDYCDFEEALKVDVYSQ